MTGITSDRQALYDDWVKTHLCEPSLSLLVVDFGDSCAVKMEQGGYIDSLPIFRGESERRLVITQFLGAYHYTFEEFRSAIDAHFAEDKPVPRIEIDKDGLGVDLYFEKYASIWLPSHGFTLFNQLARAAGATKDLPIHKPKQGEWTQIYPTGSYNVQMEWVKEQEAPVPKVAEISEYSCHIWRYTHE